jgi:hypothetical protein
VVRSTQLKSSNPGNTDPHLGAVDACFPAINRIVGSPAAIKYKPGSTSDVVAKESHLLVYIPSKTKMIS